MTTASVITQGTKIAAIRSARRWADALVLWASPTSRVIWASRVSPPTRVARTTSRPLMFKVAPVTSSPGPTSAGVASPVTSEASTADRPSVTTPSVAIFSPGRTTNSSSAARVSTGTRCSVPSRSTATVLAAIPASAVSAAPDRDRARASRYRPVSTAAGTPAATSKYSGCCPARNEVKANPIDIDAVSAPVSSPYSDQPNDTTTAMLTSVSMVAAPWPRPAQAVRCSGHAPQTATGAASSRLTQGQPVNWAAGTMASTITARASGTHTASRRPSARVSASGAPGSTGSGAGRGAVTDRFDDPDQLAGFAAAHDAK